MMAKNVADLMWEMLQSAGVKRGYGIVGDALNRVLDALRRNGEIEFVHVRHEKYCGRAFMGSPPFIDYRMRRKSCVLAQAALA